MKTDEFSNPGLVRAIANNMRNIQSAFRNEKELDCSENVIAESIKYWFANKIDGFVDDIAEMFTSPDRKEFDELERILVSRMEHEKLIVEEPIQLSLFDAEGNKFNGFQPFSIAKFGAMIEYISFKGKKVFQTNLNKLLFYSDFYSYYLTKKGISGAIYSKLEFGPVPDGYKNVLNGLKKRKRIRVINIGSRGKGAQIIRAMKTYRPGKSILSKDEIKVLDYVLSRFGDLSSDEISKRSHGETAYMDTEWTEPIDYDKADELDDPPPTSLLGDEDDD